MKKVEDDILEEDVIYEIIGIIKEIGIIDGFNLSNEIFSLSNLI